MVSIRATMILLAGQLLASTLFGQVILPRNEFRISVRGFKAAQAHVYDQQGPNTTFTGWHPSGFGLSVTYSNLGSHKSGLILTAGLNRAPFSIRWDRQLTTLGGYTDYPDGREGEPVDKLDHWLVGAGYGFVLKSKGRYRLIAEASALVTWMYPMRRDLLMYIQVNEQAVFVSAWQLKVNTRGRAIPLLACRLTLARTLGNLNTLYLSPWLQISPQNDVYQGAYVLYPGSEHESSGAYRAGVGAAGIELGYGLTWGKPKLPRYMRKGRWTMEALDQ